VAVFLCLVLEFILLLKIGLLWVPGDYKVHPLAGGHGMSFVHCTRTCCHVAGPPAHLLQG
jgi:hypothetical protein